MKHISEATPHTSGKAATQTIGGCAEFKAVPVGPGTTGAQKSCASLCISGNSTHPSEIARKQTLSGIGDELPIRTAASVKTSRGGGPGLGGG